MQFLAQLRDPTSGQNYAATHSLGFLTSCQVFTRAIKSPYFCIVVTAVVLNPDVVTEGHSIEVSEAIG